MILFTFFAVLIYKFYAKILYNKEIIMIIKFNVNKKRGSHKGIYKGVAMSFIRARQGKKGTSLDAKSAGRRGVSPFLNKIL